MSLPERIDYPDRDALFSGICDAVSAGLATAINARGRASLAVPGGTTPGPFLRALSQADLDWSKISVMLSDERLVPQDDPRSNMRLLRETLLQNRAASAQVIGFLGDRATVLEDVSACLPLDVLVVGMGLDMHTASLFPDAPELAAALDPDAPVLVEMTPTDQPEKRISLSGAVLRNARAAHILITGADKSDALAQAMNVGPVAQAPIRVILTSPNPVYIHHAT